MLLKFFVVAFMVTLRLSDSGFKVFDVCVLWFNISTVVDSGQGGLCLKGAHVVWIQKVFEF